MYVTRSLFQSAESQETKVLWRPPSFTDVALHSNCSLVLLPLHGNAGLTLLTSVLELAEEFRNDPRNPNAGRAGNAAEAH